jgi:hypothetical protein
VKEPSIDWQEADEIADEIEERFPGPRADVEEIPVVLVKLADGTRFSFDDPLEYRDWLKSQPSQPKQKES